MALGFFTRGAESGTGSLQALWPASMEMAIAASPRWPAPRAILIVMDGAVGAVDYTMPPRASRAASALCWWTRSARRWFTWRRRWVDGGSSGEAFAHWVKTLRPKLDAAVAKRSDAAKGFGVPPRRGVVERTFGWSMRPRRLGRDFATAETSAEAWSHLAMIRIQLRRPA